MPSEDTILGRGLDRHSAKGDIVTYRHPDVARRREKHSE